MPKRYKHREKKYRGILLRIPKSFQGKVDPFLGVDFTMKGIITRETADEKIMDIVLVTSKHAVSRQLKQTA